MYQYTHSATEAEKRLVARDLRKTLPDFAAIIKAVSGEKKKKKTTKKNR